MAKSPPTRHRITIRDVARSCEVDISTVSRILNNRFENFSASEEKIRLVHATAKQLGYRPNRFAQSLRSQRSTFIAVSFPGIKKESFDAADGGDPDDSIMLGGNMMMGIVHGAFISDYQTLMLPRLENSPGPLDAEQIVPEIVAGTIYTMPTILHQEYASLHQAQRPVVLMGRCPDGYDIPSCDIDNVSEARRLTERLIKRGARKIALLLPAPQHFLLAQDRKQGHIEALRAHDLPVREEWLMTDDATAMQPMTSLRACLQAYPELDGVVLGSDWDIPDMIRVLQDVRPDWRQSLKVAAFLWKPEFERDFPELTQLQVRFFQMGLQAARLMVRLLQGEDTGGAVARVPCGLVN